MHTCPPPYSARVRGGHPRVPYEEYGRRVYEYDFCKEGLAHFHFHPANLPERSTLLPLARFESNSEHLQNAQRR